jgi:predicted small secreted protein
MLKIFVLGVDLGIVIGAFIYLYVYWMFERKKEAMRLMKQRIRMGR